MKDDTLTQCEREEPGRPARRSNGFKRHDTTSLFAALDIATGRIIGKCYGRHRAAEFRNFPDEIEASVPLRTTSTSSSTNTRRIRPIDPKMAG
ncbi:hypothetical protein ACIPUD_37610 [Bradyrhizobium sp. CAR08]